MLHHESKEQPVVFTSDRSVDPSAYSLAPALFNGMYHYAINLNSDDSWKGSIVTVVSAWGDGTNGRDLWGWEGGASVVASPIVKIDGVYRFALSLEILGKSEFVSAVFRLKLASGAPRVGCLTFRYSNHTFLGSAGNPG